MKKEIKMKCYEVMVSTKLPATHPCAGRPTDFERLVLEGIKITTMRGKYAKWLKRIEEINEGKAYLSLRVWDGASYGKGVKQREIKRLYHAGIQEIEVSCSRINIHSVSIDGQQDLRLPTIASNDGLSVHNMLDWLCPNGEPFSGCIIHFTNFRY